MQTASTASDHLIAQLLQEKMDSEGDGTSSAEEAGEDQEENKHADVEETPPAGLKRRRAAQGRTNGKRVKTTNSGAAGNQDAEEAQTDESGDAAEAPKLTPKQIINALSKPSKIGDSTSSHPFADTKQWQSALKRDGYAVVSGVLPQDKVRELTATLRTDLTGLGTGCDLDQPQTLTNANWVGIHSVGMFKVWLSVNAPGRSLAPSTTISLT